MISDTSFDSSDLLDMLPRQYWVGMFTYLLFGFKLRFLFCYQTTIINILMETQKKLILNFFSAKVSLSPSSKKLFLRFSVWDDLLPTPKNARFLARSLPKLHEPFPSNALQ